MYKKLSVVFKNNRDGEILDFGTYVVNYQVANINFMCNFVEIQKKLGGTDDTGIIIESEIYPIEIIHSYRAEGVC